MANDYSDLGLPDSTLVKPITGTVNTINSDLQIEDSSIDPIKLTDELLFNEASGYTGAGTVTISNSGGAYTAWTDIGNGLSIKFSTPKTANIYFYHIGNYEMDTNGTDTTTDGQIRMLLDDSPVGTIIDIYAGLTGGSSKLMSTYSLVHTEQVPAGTHTIKLQWRCIGGGLVLAGTTFLSLTAGTHAATLGFIVLGK